MPFPITKGLGNQGDGSSSALLITQGYGDPQAAASCFAFSLITIEVYQDRLELVFSTNVQVVGPAAIPSQWTITTAVPGVTIPTVTSIQVVGPRIKLFITEPRDGVLYTLNFPAVGIEDLSANPYPGPFTTNFTGIGTPPYVALAGAEDGFHVKVIFSEIVVESEALVAGNYLITGGAGLTVYDVFKETDQVYRLRTSLQVVGQTYTVTVSNIHDLIGNLI